MNMNKKTVWIIGGVSGVAVVTPLIGPTLANEVIAGDFSVLSAVKWSSIIAGTGLALFFLVRHGVFANENLEEGERGYRRRWGKIVTKRDGSRKLLRPGKKHFYVKHWYDVVVQSVRLRSSPEEPELDKPIRFTFRGKSVWAVLVVDWQVIDKEEYIYNSITKVYQIKRAQEGNDALENYVLNQLHKVFIRCVESFNADSNGLPVITVNQDVGTVPEQLCQLLVRLRETYGVRIVNIDPVLLTLAPEEAIRDLKT